MSSIVYPSSFIEKTHNENPEPLKHYTPSPCLEKSLLKDGLPHEAAVE